jgi:hypothetical protein
MQVRLMLSAKHSRDFGAARMASEGRSSASVLAAVQLVRWTNEIGREVATLLRR